MPGGRRPDSRAAVRAHHPGECEAVDGRVPSHGRAEVSLSDDHQVELQIGFENVGIGRVNLSEDPSVTASIERKFVGGGPGGPQAVIGMWTLRSPGDNARVGTGDKIYAAFGAERTP